MTEEAGQTVHESVARQKLPNTQQVEDPTEDALEAGNPGDGALHVADSGDGGQKMRQPHLGRNVQPVVMHGHEGRRAHGVADILEVGLAGDLQDLGDLGGYVVLGHLVPCEVPEHVVGGCEVGMVSAKENKYIIEAKPQLCAASNSPQIDYDAFVLNFELLLVSDQFLLRKFCQDGPHRHTSRPLTNTALLKI